MFFCFVEGGGSGAGECSRYGILHAGGEEEEKEEEEKEKEDNMIKEKENIKLSLLSLRRGVLMECSFVDFGGARILPSNVSEYIATR